LAVKKKSRDNSMTSDRRQRRALARSQGRSDHSSEAALLSRTWLLCLLLALSTFAIYLRVLGQPFTDYDDDTYVGHNDHVSAGLTWDTVTWAFTSTEESNWHPVTWLSHALDVELYGLNPGGHHFTNLLFHVSNTLLLFLLLTWATGEVWRSFLVAALFAIHPINVESVAWIAERKNVLSTFFFLLTIGAYGWYAVKPSVRRGTAVVVLFVLGLASKPMLVTLPFVLLLLDFWPLRRISGWTEPSSKLEIPQAPSGRLLREKAPLLLISAGSAVITVLAQGAVVKPLATFPFGVRLENAGYAYLLYVWKAFWPVPLAPYYPHPGNTLTIWQVALAGLFLVGISLLAWLQRRVRPYFLAGWLWFLGTLVPVIGFVQIGDQAMADRYAYVPLIGIFVIAVWYASDLANNYGLNLMPRSVTAAVVLLTLAGLTVHQIGYWQTPLTFWSHTLEVTKDNPVAEANLAADLMDMGHENEALAHFQNVVRNHPNFSASHLNIAGILQSRRQIPEAMAEYSAASRAASLNPRDVTNSQVLAVSNAKLGTLYAEQGEYEKARQAYEQALRINSAALDGEISILSRQVAARPAATKYLCLGILLQQVGRRSEAVAAFLQALQLDPALEEARRSLQELQAAK
jgi:hypothetical protein